MELREFIQATIQQIIDGVVAVQRSAKESGAVIPGGHPNSSTCGHFKFLHLIA